ncbi:MULTISPECIES: 4-oxalocrotonate tautomerase DmpI [Carboxydothermus]|uniref:4-oxalocrotonate tautomerase n=2 Tax=Carboxydothermus TaxID=129957 RepID=A0ABX2R6J9_9THEO|nr:MULTISPECIES: 4-oxalocrotonate tautomerase DmpI [Carboxydothermus]ABB14680.1 putative 4-oxalocrotonate tautomerase [Carboxydothermus hydrogenoformans Z-2901]NYE56794.1 4-oxalocrotonate tautomerase [Carboxydothermus ferrireducens DSM 11255]
MPVIQIDAGPMSKEKKAELIKNLTDAASSTLNIPPQAFIVIIRENSLDNVGSGGKPLAEINK